MTNIDFYKRIGCIGCLILLLPFLFAFIIGFLSKLLEN